MRGMDVLDIGRYLAALLMVLALLGFAALAVRRYGMPGIVKPKGTRRLAVVETLMIGPRQKLHLVRRDGVEHLIMTGPEGMSVVESGIVAPASLETARAEAAA